MPEVNINVEVYCSCGEGLCNQTESKLTRTRGEPCFIVDPCETCMEKAKNSGYDEGFEAGYKDGKSEHE